SVVLPAAAASRAAAVVKHKHRSDRRRRASSRRRRHHQATNGTRTTRTNCHGFVLRDRETCGKGLYEPQDCSSSGEQEALADSQAGRDGTEHGPAETEQKQQGISEGATRDFVIPGGRGWPAEKSTVVRRVGETARLKVQFISRRAPVHFPRLRRGGTGR